jgi:hypothetical protein
MAIDPKRVQELFLRIVQLPPDARVVALDLETGSDRELRARVEALIKAHDTPGSSLDQFKPQLEATFLSDLNVDPQEPVAPSEPKLARCRSIQTGHVFSRPVKKEKSNSGTLERVRSCSS